MSLLTIPDYRIFVKNINANGGRANSLVLDIFESTFKDGLKGVNGTAVRPRIERGQIIHPEDVLRTAELRCTFSFEDRFKTGSNIFVLVISSVQPIHS